MRSVRSLLSLGIPLLLWCTATPALADMLQEKELPEFKTPIETLAFFQQAWLQGMSEEIAKAFQTEGVFLFLGEDGPPAGTYSASQIRYLIGDLLRFAATDSFDFIKFDRKKKEEKARATVLWIYTRDSDAQPKEQELNLVLVKSDRGWIISSLATAD